MNVSFDKKNLLRISNIRDLTERLAQLDLQSLHPSPGRKAPPLPSRSNLPSRIPLATRTQMTAFWSLTSTSPFAPQHASPSHQQQPTPHPI